MFRRGTDNRGSSSSRCADFGSEDERGIAMVELSIVLTVLALLVLGAIDLGRLAGYQNRMENAAREGGAIVQMSPGSVNAGCQGDRNVTDRVASQNPELAANSGYAVVVEHKRISASGEVTYVPYTGCGTPTSGAIAPGDRVRVTVKAEVAPSGALTSAIFGSEMSLSESIEVVVQG